MPDKLLNTLVEESESIACAAWTYGCILHTVEELFAVLCVSNRHLIGALCGHPRAPSCSARGS